ncbi:hypothetical protein [Qingshengfaniella alkalisoli]|uniref:Uncharacterized protein n=1 Tax=Qingshengfaniella alkalisoli TaxID=2599296 RepID=A0A5B8IB38_9RHOB|nr:hypothetical protein [Qingshengfaniella alkalisoli]QDY71349.1 hypothetical protein FPZ52_16745 [Qingshengfaniella alkalisoli]
MQLILRFLGTCSPTVDKVPEGFIHLLKSAEESQARVKDFLELMFLGHLTQVYRVAGEYGFAAMVVDLDDTESLLVPLAPSLSQDSYFLID